MVLSRPFTCPTRVVQGRPFDEALSGLLENRRWALVTSAGWISRGVVHTLRRDCGAPAATIADVTSNPPITTVTRLAKAIPDVDAVVALGGGSVIDAAKGAVALRALGHDLAAFMAHLRDGEPLPDSLDPVAILAVPTTSGTGSEVTPWGTIWGEDGIKHSVNHPALYPTDAVLDPALCRSMPVELTVATGLDALSHAMESVWNRRHTPATDAIAEHAIGMLRDYLGAAVAEPGDVEPRRRVQTASLLAGLAMGTTQTALAHSISYPFTSRFGLPHGFACSFTLPEVARYNIDADAARLTPIARGLGCAVDAVPGVLEAWFDELDLGVYLGHYVHPDVVDGFGDNMITRTRAANNIRDVDGAAAREIARAALKRFCPSAELRRAVNT